MTNETYILKNIEYRHVFEKKKNLEASQYVGLFGFENIRLKKVHLQQTLVRE